MNYDNLIDNSNNWVFKNFRSFDFILELYPDNENHSCVIDYINLWAYDDGFEYRYILHDKDIKKDGTPAKPHWHLYIRYSNNRWCSAVIKDLGLSDNRFIRDCDSKSIFLRYLVHYDDDTKYPYDISDVHTNIPNFRNLSFWRKPRKSKKSNIYKEISGEDGLIACYSLIRELFYKYGVKGVTQNMVIDTLLAEGLYKHLCGHRDLIFRYYDGIKYNR